MSEMNRITHELLANVTGGFDKERLSPEEIKIWKKLITNVEQAEKAHAAGSVSTADVNAADKRLLDFIRNMMEKYDDPMIHNA